MATLRQQAKKLGDLSDDAADAIVAVLVRVGFSEETTNLVQDLAYVKPEEDFYIVGENGRQNVLDQVGASVRADLRRLISLAYKKGDSAYETAVLRYILPYQSNINQIIHLSR